MSHCPVMQRGTALLIMLVVLLAGVSALLLQALSNPAQHVQQDARTAAALALAKQALTGDAALQAEITTAGYLRLPDLGFGVGNVATEGSSSPNFSGNSKDYSVAGKLPWRTLKLEPLHDGQQECLWYVVSGRFKNSPLTDTLNWDTPGQLTLTDANGNEIVSGAAALILSAGQLLAGQDRSLSDPAYAQCGGNYDARNYLDPANAADAISATTNYFSGSSNNRVASSAADQRFIAANDAHYNDLFLAISVDEIFRPLMRRADFAAQIAALLDDSYFQSIAISGSKGTDNVICNQLGTADNRTFCKNWKEMLLLTQLPTPASVLLEHMPSAICSRILLFGGRKTSTQQRLSTSDKSIPGNYLEGANLAAYATPVAASNNFSGSSSFRADLPDADLLRCLP